MEDLSGPGSIFSVSELTEKMRKKIEKEFPFVWVKGEVSNLGKPLSGHLYFALKDNESQIQCVWFRHNHRSFKANSFDNLTGEVFSHPRPSLADNICNGIEILCAGKIGIYAPKGQYQLIIELAEYAGEGKLALALEETRKKLAAKGFFSQGNKKIIPKNPQRVALITSPKGAAIHDFLEIANKRGFCSQIRLIPVAVQGDEAVQQIIEAIKTANSSDWPQVIAIIRGGGSLEDLWAFNDEKLAECVFNSRIPILAGIGHEIDVSIIDLVADCRAATPSHAAQILWSEKSELWQQIDDAERLLHTVYDSLLKRYENNYLLSLKNLEFCSPIKALMAKESKLKKLFSDLITDFDHYLQSIEYDENLLTIQLKNYKSIFNFDLLNEKIYNLKSSLNIFIFKFIEKNTKQLDSNKEVINNFFALYVTNLENSLKYLVSNLISANPEKFLKNGYSVILKNNKHVLSIGDLSIGDDIQLLMDGGTAYAKIFNLETLTDKEKNEIQ